MIAIKFWMQKQVINILHLPKSDSEELKEKKKKGKSTRTRNVDWIECTYGSVHHPNERQRRSCNNNSTFERQFFRRLDSRVQHTTGWMHLCVKVLVNVLHFVYRRLFQCNRKSQTNNSFSWRRRIGGIRRNSPKKQMKRMEWHSRYANVVCRVANGKGGVVVSSAAGICRGSMKREWVRFALQMSGNMYFNRSPRALARKIFKINKNDFRPKMDGRICGQSAQRNSNLHVYVYLYLKITFVCWYVPLSHNRKFLSRTSEGRGT